MKFNDGKEYNYLKVLIPLDVFEYRDITIGVTYYEEGIEDFLAKHQGLQEGDYLKLVIDLQEGYVSNWPNNCAVDFHDYKVVDCGKYALMEHEDGSGNYLEYESYVPNVIGEGGWGDYLEFEIDDYSDIVDWPGFDETDFEKFMDEYNECH